MNINDIRAKIATAQDRPLHKMHVPEWDMELTLKPFSVDCRRTITNAPNDKFYALAMIHSIVDDNGNQVFSLEDFKLLDSKSAQVAEKIAKEILRLNGLGSEAIAEAKKD